MNGRTLLVLAAVVLAAIAAWPSFVASRSQALASAATPAPIVADYLDRNQLVAVYEGDVKRHPDQIITRMLASQYLMRYRETGDVSDLLRAERLARRSLAMQPRNNVGADMTLASALQSLHQFRAALAYARKAAAIEPWSTAAITQTASIETELGHYDEAARLLRSAHPGPQTDVGLNTAQARYEELAGQMAQARRLIDGSLVAADSVIDSPAEARAWFHFRAGEMAWAVGDAATAKRRFREALEIFPNYARAYTALARLYCAQHRWREALDAADRAANLVPLPETLGYKADAERALGDADGAQQTEDLIRAIERIGNVRGINDRAIATYYADHRLDVAEAVRIARRDLAARDDIFAEDTLAWALAADGRWRQARAHAQRAVKLGTEDARLQFHAGVIALHCGDRGEARTRLERALALNPHFHPTFAEEARRLLTQL